MDVRTEVVRASEMREKVFNVLAETREAVFAEYEKKLAEYKKAKSTRKEVVGRVETGPFYRKVSGFYKLIDGEPEFHEKPHKPKPLMYRYRAYDREMARLTDGSMGHAEGIGFLADPQYNRDIRPQRVDKYTEAMERGEWKDLLSDPISITADGQVLNGQHRMAAVEAVDWDEVENDPAFMVIWGAEPKEAIFADGSRRTGRDEKTIAARVVSAA